MIVRSRITSPLPASGERSDCAAIREGAQSNVPLPLVGRGRVILANCLRRPPSLTLPHKGGGKISVQPFPRKRGEGAKGVTTHARLPRRSKKLPPPWPRSIGGVGRRQSCPGSQRPRLCRRGRRLEL